VAERTLCRGTYMHMHTSIGLSAPNRAHALLRVCPSQYQVRLDHCEADGSSLIYAPRDDDCYIRRPLRRPATIASSRRLSQERRFLQKLEASLNCRSDDRKQMMYDTLRERHKQAMQLIIDDVVKLGSRNPCVIV
jgi:hypothetical protein